ncbi:hypothetical protein EJ02DRAFT_364255 [Clathrospora elynae]|uniref:WD40 repeat-like protein n=1 Tax=Clathrospora elynae TaxID=706981 RepID=A0A6A5T5I4_9PLEO|nr:hypothetical protein EJ02DRAFT_364255 [Clathrospora elynae]
MSAEPSPRQSRGKQRKSYRVEDEYSFLDEDEDGSTPSRTRTPALQEDDNDDGDDFMPDAQEEEPEEDLDEDVIEDDEDDAEAVDEENTDDEFMEPRRHAARGSNAIGMGPILGPNTPKSGREKLVADNIPSPVTFAKGGGIKVRSADNENKLRTRGVADFEKVGGHEPRLKTLFGPESEDLKPILTSRDYWISQETLPIRRPDTIRLNDPFFGSLRRSFFETSEARKKEIKTLRTWYVDTGKYVLAKAQKCRELSTTEGKAYMGTSGRETMNVLWGPANNPQVHTLQKGSRKKIAEAFDNDQKRRGWLFHLGSRVKEAQWATNEDNSTQYLAVAVEQKSTACWQPNPMENPKAPAFNPTHPYAASVQIWAFEATKKGELDTSKEPRLELVICTDWGEPKQLRWCPVGATDGSKQSNNEQGIHLGLLAGTWSDGRARILDVIVPSYGPNTDVPTYVHYSRAAFEVQFPSTIPSCLHWLSGTTLAVATAAGTVGIWTMTRPGTLAAPEIIDHSPKPWFYQQLADTYILTISSGWPSQPHYLSISTADGFARLFDLRSPNADTTASIRGRTLCLTQSWHEQTQSFVMPDEHYMLKHTPIRRYYHNLYSMRLESSITRVATSPVHPGVLIGGTDGTVETSNPIGRIVNYKVIPWQQKWFVHEWRGPIDNMLVKLTQEEDVQILEAGPVEQPADTSLPGTQDGDTASPSIKPTKVPHAILSQPLVRITEGYKATQPGIAHTIMTKKSNNNPDVGKGVTIFEEESAITTLAWNPNLKFGTWAVAGMASGLLRVEDIGITAKE